MIKIPEGKARIVIERVTPVVDSGRFPVKKTVGEVVIVEADILVDGHDAISAEVLYRHESESDWNATAMVLVAKRSVACRLPRAGVRNSLLYVAGLDRSF